MIMHYRFFGLTGFIGLPFALTSTAGCPCAPPTKIAASAKKAAAAKEKKQLSALKEKERKLKAKAKKSKL